MVACRSFASRFAQLARQGAQGRGGRMSAQRKKALRAPARLAFLGRRLRLSARGRGPGSRGSDPCGRPCGPSSRDRSEGFETSSAHANSVAVASVAIRPR
eukprot:5038484-Alexandrium_andersonii.AAC.1